MIITTTTEIDGQSITEYTGIVFGEVIAGINAIKDFKASIRNAFGGRATGYEDEMKAAREDALREMEQRAAELNADAIVGVKMDYEALGSDNGMLMVTCSGTAVKLR